LNLPPKTHYLVHCPSLLKRLGLCVLSHSPD
jgi:hypothetical protein